MPLAPLLAGIGKKRWVSIGDWPCLAVMMIVVESSRCGCFSSSDELADGAVDELEFAEQSAVGVPAASV